MNLKIMDPENFKQLGGTDPYYTNIDRWELYFKYVVEDACHLDLNLGSKILEIGAYRTPVFLGCTLMDTGNYGPVTCKTVLHNANTSPWPFEKNSFDLIIASHIIEHLDKTQKTAFLEMKRISKKYILVALPFRWRGEDKYHDNIGLNIISEWSSGMTPMHSRIVGSLKTRKTWIGTYDLEK